MGNEIIPISTITLKITKGTTPTSIGCSFVQNGINFVKSESITGSRTLDRTKFACIDEITHSRLLRSQLMKNDILFSMAGVYLGKTAIVTEEDVPANTNQAVAIIRVDPTKANFNYVYYWLSQPQITESVNAACAQSAQPNINLAQIGDILINLPTLGRQRLVAATLSCLDDKIELNTRIIANLEAQAQAIFKSWFVDFEPFQDGEFEDSELGLIPEGWKVGTFSEIIDKLIPGDWGKDNPEGNNTQEVFCIRGADIPDVRNGNKGKMPVRYILPKNFNLKQLEANDLVTEISGGSPTQSTGRIAFITQSLLSRYDKPMICTNFCKAIKPREGFAAFVYYYWQYLYNLNILFSYENGTTGIKNLNISGFVEVEKVIIPDVKTASQFNEIVMGIQEFVFSLGKQNEQLAMTRDALLPKLMSGEIEVPVEG